MITSQQIKDFANKLGFDACGICKAEPIDNESRKEYELWLANGFHADMDYLGRNVEKRFDPRLLVEGSKSIICVALNYYPENKQPLDHPQFSYYAYGKDYHEVVKNKLYKLLSYIKSLVPHAEGRAFVDTAPVLERYWAEKAGLGFVGKNSLLIIPQKGSYFFLGELIINLELDYDSPINISCGNCSRCIENCPTKAICNGKIIDSDKCISYQTIENKGEIGNTIIPSLNNWVYGCDICQQVCPFNRFAKPAKTAEFKPSKAFLDLSFSKLDELTEDEYLEIFKGSAVKRAKYTGLKRNFEVLKEFKKNKKSETE